MLASKRRWSLILVGAIVLLAIVSLHKLGERERRTALARTLVEASYDSPRAALGAEEVWYFQTTLFHRLNPTLQAPRDPYHRPAAWLFADGYIVEQWQGHRQRRTTAYDKERKEIIFDQVHTETFDGIYDALSGYAHLFQASQPTSTPGEPLASWMSLINSDGARLMGTLPSEWGTEAWLVQKQEETKPLPPDPATGYAPPVFQEPYWADLPASALLHSWLIDRASGRLIHFKTEALTPTGNVLVAQVASSNPKAIPLADLPADWLAFPPPGVPIAQTTPAAPVLPPSTSLPEALAQRPFQVFLPDPDTAALDLVETRYSPPAHQPPQETWRFDIQEAASQGLALETVYLPLSQEGDKTLVVIQGSRARLVPQMREILPIWQQSHPVSLSFAGTNSQGWLATGGVLATPPAQTVLMLEQAGTFLFIVGQGYNEQELLALASTFHLIQ